MQQNYVARFRNNPLFGNTNKLGHVDSVGVTVFIFKKQHSVMNNLFVN